MTYVNVRTAEAQFRVPLFAQAEADSPARSQTKPHPMISRLLRLLLPALAACACAASLSAADWKPAAGPLATRWAKDVSPENALPEYPRPQMVREEWQNLNGLWDYAIADKDAAQPAQWDGQILVPFPVESALSGVMKPRRPRSSGSGIAARSRCPAALEGPSACCCTSARWIGRRRCASTARSSARTAAATMASASTSPTRSSPAASRRSSWPCGTRPIAARSRAASRCSSPAASCTPPPAASGRRCGWSRCRRRTSRRCASCPTSISVVA